jgi:TolB protein
MPADISPYPFRDMEIKRRARQRRFRLWILVFIALGLAFIVLNERLTGNPLHAQAQVRSSSTALHGVTMPGTGTLAGWTARPQATSTPTHLAPTSTITATITPPETIPNTQSAPFLESLALENGTLFYSMSEGGYYHLFAYHPQNLPFTRLTNGAWDDITPAASPDGAHLAFASNRGGHWDLYILDLASGEISQVTDTPEYDASPSWSPDGQWLVYESYVPLDGEGSSGAQAGSPTPIASGSTENLDLFIRPVTQSDGTQQETIRLTNDPAADTSPAWSPSGRQIAFVSNRSGDEEVWLADLDRVDDRFQNISFRPRASDQYPAWSPDGKKLAWASSFDGFQNLYIQDVSQLKTPDMGGAAAARQVGNGTRPVWSSSGGYLFTALRTPNQTYLAGYPANAPGLTLPPIPLPGSLDGLSWGTGSLQDPLPEPMQQAAQVTAVPAWQTALTPAADIPASRQRVVELQDVEAPYPYLHDLVDESFAGLRSTIATRIGWDFLSTLENAYVPLTTPLFPGMLEDWLYTGRAFTLNPGPMNAGWMVVQREDFAGNTYWRVFVRTRYQDGTQGKPLSQLPWNFNARYSGDPRYYEQGGAYAPLMPSGYWLDLTQLAADYGWERLPALITWRSAMAAARFNEFIVSDGLDWPAAMNELYPASALVTATPASPPTLSPTKTRWPTRTPTPTRTPRPTRTPAATQTSVPAKSPTVTQTP